MDNHLGSHLHNLSTYDEDMEKIFGEPDKVTDCANPLAEMERGKGSPKQKVNEYIKYLNRWLEFAGEDKFVYLRTSKKQFVVKRYDSSQIDSLITKTKGHTVEDETNHALVMLALNTGLRRSELANLKTNNIHKGYLSVLKGKGEKNRDVYLDENTREVPP